MLEDTLNTAPVVRHLGLHRGGRVTGVGGHNPEDTPAPAIVPDNTAWTSKDERAAAGVSPFSPKPEVGHPIRGPEHRGAISVSRQTECTSIPASYDAGWAGRSNDSVLACAVPR